MYYRVIVASRKYHGDEALTYKSILDLKPGQIVDVPLAKVVVSGIVENKTTKPDFAVKDILKNWEIFVPPQSVLLIKWLKMYYPAPMGLVAELISPPKLTNKLNEVAVTETNNRPKSLPKLTPEQTSALKNIFDSKSESVLLHGETATGKTRIYVELAKKSIDDNKSVIILTPEIGLTGQLLATFKETFGSRVLVTHSDMTNAQRRKVWLMSSTSEVALIIIGPRSAIFSPLKNIGLVVMDEAHDSAYKQEQAPRYQTSRVASKLAKLHHARFVMGSATPLITDYYAFLNKNLNIVNMKIPAIKASYPINTTLIDLRNKESFSKSQSLANPLLKAIETALKNNEQSLLFLNRRGSARLIICNNCGWQAICPNCDIALTYHHDSFNMRCHSCDYSGRVPQSCPKCHGQEMIFRSIGTKALESEIKRIFPKARVSRFDRDTEKSMRLSQQLADLQSGKIDVLIGTQTIAKGFDLPRLSVVGIIQADSGLQIPDYTATERTYQLISQVSGRIGRGHRPSSLFLQTYEPDSELIKLALNKDYKNFLQTELKQREIYKFPPYFYLLKITCARSSSKSAHDACNKIVGELARLGNGIIVEGPSPRFVEKIAGKYAWHLVVKSKSRNNLLSIIDKLPSNCSFDIDPADLL